MKKVLLTLVGLTLCSTLALAQWGDESEDDTPSLRDRVFTGGNIGANFSKYYDYVSVSPLVGYNITPKLAAGVQGQYRYIRYKDTQYKISTHNYGLGPFVRYNIYAPFFLHAEYEYLNYEFPLSYSSRETGRDSFNSFLAGGGFFQALGSRAGFFLLALYNFSYSDPQPGEYSPYDTPLVLRVGVTAGF